MGGWDVGGLDAVGEVIGEIGGIGWIRWIFSVDAQNYYANFIIKRIKIGHRW